KIGKFPSHSHSFPSSQLSLSPLSLSITNHHHRAILHCLFPVYLCIDKLQSNLHASPLSPRCPTKQVRLNDKPLSVVEHKLGYSHP
ncbi:hypothetical protein VIGAN_04096000, partial [Vigna angularis var. angularis]